MKYLYKFLAILLFQLCFIYSVKSQTINILRFNNTANYVSGSGVSVIMNPQGIFRLDNKFILELSDVGGTFNTPRILNTIDEFYTPVINGRLPSGLTPGNYKLRIRATMGLATTPGTDLVEETFPFTIAPGSSDVPSATSAIQNGSTFFNCTSTCLNTTNSFGSLIQSAGANTSAITNLTIKKITICEYSSSDAYLITLIDVLKETQTTVSYNPSNGEITIPDNLPIGTYVFEIAKNDKSFYSLVFLFHGNGTSVGNSTSPSVCNGAEVSFTVDKNVIGRNYNGSKYTFDFGDNSGILELTHAQLMANSTVTHLYETVSCDDSDDSRFNVIFNLFNKGVSSSGNPNFCTNFYKNGGSASITVNVSSAPEADFDLPNKQCINTEISAKNTTIPGSYGTAGVCESESIFSWYYKKPSATSFTLVTDASWIDSDNNLNIPENINNESGCWEIQLTAVNPDLSEVCLTESTVMKIIKIEPKPIASFTYTPQSPICTNTAIQFTNTSNVDASNCQEPTYLWTVSPSIGYEFVNTTSSTSRDATILFTNPGLYTVTLSVTNSCGTETNTSNTIEVSGTPIVRFDSDSLTVCNASPLNYTLDFSQTGTTPIYGNPPFAPTNYEWTVTGTDVTASDYSYTGGTTASSPYPKINFTSYKTYTITVFTNGNCSIAGSGQATFTLILKETPKIKNTDLTQIICSGSLSAAIPLTSNLVGTTYSWTATATTGITGFNVEGSGSSIPANVLNNSTNSVGTVTYSVTPTNNRCVGLPVSFVRTVNPKPFVSTQTKTSCSGTAFTVSPANSSGNILPINTTYTWTNPVSNPLGAITGGSPQATGQINISQTLTNRTNFPATLTYTVTPKSGASGNCDGDSFEVIVTVNPRPAPLVVDNQEYCNGATTAPIIFSNDVADTSYAWTNSNTAIGLNASGTGNIPSFTAQNTGSSPITATISVTPTANGCVGTTQTFTITVNPAPAVTFSLSNQSICSGDTSAVVTLSSVEEASIKWTTEQPPGLSIISLNGTNTIPAETMDNNTNADIVVTYKATARLPEGTPGSDCPETVFTYTITVKPRPFIAENITAVSCSGSLFTVTPTNESGNSIPAGTTYSWGIPEVTDGLTGGNVGTNQTTISGTLTNPTNLVQTATYTVTPIVNGCIGLPFYVVVSVNPKPDVNTTPNVVLCAGESSTQIDFSGSVSGTTYNWTSNTTSIGIAASGSDTIPSFIAINTGTTPLIATITITPSANSCQGSAKTFTITVNPTPIVNPVSNLIKCNGAASGTITFAGNVTGTTFDWVNDTPSIGLAASGSGNIPSFTTINLGLTTVNATITVTPKANGCLGTPLSFTITVKPSPTVDTPSNQTVCNGLETTAVVFSGAITNTIYNWTNSNSTIGLDSSGSGDIPAFTTTNKGDVPIVATITVTPNLDGCDGNPITFTITVNPSPSVIFSTSNQTICSGSSSVEVNLSSSSAGSTFTWEATEPAGITGVIASGTNTIPVQTLINSTNLPIEITYLATAVSNSVISCTGSAYTYTITVNPVPLITTTLDQTICSDTTFSIIPLDGGGNNVPASTTYSWGIPIVSAGIIGAVSATNQTEISATLQNTTNDVQTATYTVIPKSGNCTGTPFTVVITVNPAPKVLFLRSNQTLCSGSSSLPITLSSPTTGNVSFSWSANIPTGISGATATGTDTIPIQTLTNNATTPLTVIYTAVATTINNGVSCTGQAWEYKITVNPIIVTSSIVSNFNGFNVSEFGATNGTIGVTVTGGSGDYTYIWSRPDGFSASSQDLTNVPAGLYTLVINDGLCSPITLNFTLTSPDPLLIEEDIAAHINVFCFSNATGAIKVNITQESVSPYDYELKLQGGAIISTITNSTLTSYTFTNLAAGTYDLKVTDANESEKFIRGIIITQPDEIIISAATTAISCYGDNNASITLTISGGIEPYKIEWSNLGSGTFQDNLSAGDYIITVTDALGCVKTLKVNIPEAPLFTVYPVVKNISCNGANDGSINLNIDGGVAPVKLVWDDNSSAGNIRNNLEPGDYTVTISDGNSCIITKTFYILEPLLLVLTRYPTIPSDCNSTNGGSIDLLISGGTTPYTYAWSNGATTEDLTNFPAGNYSVTVTDANGCSKQAQYSINSIVTNVVTKTDFDCENKTLTQTFVGDVSGGVPPYQLVWSSGTVSGANGEIMNPSQNGEVTLTATDAIGCTSNYTFDVDVPILGTPSFDASSYAYVTYGDYSINDPIQFTNTATGDFVSMIWDFGDGATSTELNPVHTFINPKDYVVTQTVTYPFGCVYVQEITFTVGKGYVLVVPTAFTPNNDGLNDAFKPVAKGLKNVRLDVFDTWGSMIYSESGDVFRGWDGRIKSSNAENGNYNCKVSGETFYGTIVNENHPFVLIK